MSVHKAKTFEEIGVAKWLCDGLAAISITQPTEIQAACIPQILDGKDTIGASRTGSGKTGLRSPSNLQKLAEDPYGPYALVLTPTRELAYQIAEQFRILGTGISLKLSVVVGGMDMMKQALELTRRPHVIVATPGRLADHIRSSANAINFKKLQFLVMDECDRLLMILSSEDLEEILNVCPKKRQTLLFTATLTEEIEQLNFSAESKPFVYQCAARFDTVEKLDQRYVFIPSTVRDAYMAYMVRTMLPNKTMIIFTGKCRTAERVRVLLRELGVRSTALHAQMSQNDRLGSLAKFKSGIVPILIATDLPADAADYVHRVGRTARAGKGGLSVSLVTERDIDILQNIEGKINKKLEEYPVPEKPVLDTLNEVGLAKRVANMHLVDTKFGEKKRTNMEKHGLIQGGDKKRRKTKD
ncbi:DEAD-domain-containing protein [Rhizoclosmatium globosum]|uniref:DEAD-domain-containing protein n=1 Tax=Rhizoclosmatium globosum TaxID=329046 RepID=A0A1Y2BZ56_9FUNG|nr:DEAD-domain-containing protein [Rhizoclosmatium globosum]|eukprot:ORY40006.1 DEAD-domain-containing protein [Rhizoclosmatium globosum]